MSQVRLQRAAHNRAA